MVTNSWMQLWHTRFREFNINANSYTLNRSISKFVVFAKISLSRSQCYIGMTSVGMHKRNLARGRKLRQLQQGYLVNCEPALRWWHKDHSYDPCMCIILKIHDSTHATMMSKLMLIAQFQPSLNTPFIHKFFNSTAAGQKAIICISKTQTRCGKPQSELQAKTQIDRGRETSNKAN